MEKPLAGKVALITGGSRGIGAAIAMRLAKEGAKIAISYVASAEKAAEVVDRIKAVGTDAVAFKADQSKSDEVTHMVQAVWAHYGQIDIFVNSAAVLVMGVVGDPEIDVSLYDHQYAVNVGGLVAAVRAVVPLMTDGGRIIAIGTTGASRVPFAGLGDYVATKAAVAAYTRAWARDLGPRNINVNVIQPGFIDTDMNPDGTEMAAELARSTALGRYGSPEEIAGAVAFLAGPDATYITGTTLNVDGGQVT